MDTEVQTLREDTSSSPDSREHACQTTNYRASTFAGLKSRNSSTAEYPKSLLLTNMLTSGLLSEESAASHAYASTGDPSVATLKCGSEEETAASYPTTGKPRPRMRSLVFTPASKSNLKALVDFMPVTNPGNYLADYVGVIPKISECPSNAVIFRLWQTNESYCEVCSKYCLSKAIYKEHYLLHRSLHAEGDYFKCFQCKHLMNKYYIKEHVKIHSMHKNSYKNHSEVHARQNLMFSCCKCDRDFPDAYTLARHAAVQHKRMSRARSSETKRDNNVMYVMQSSPPVRRGLTSTQRQDSGVREVQKSSVNTMVIKQEVLTQDAVDIDAMATKSDEHDVSSTPMSILEGANKQDAIAKPNVPRTNVTIKEEPTSVDFDAVEMGVTLPRFSCRTAAEDSSVRHDSSQYLNACRQPSKGRSRENKYSEVERITVASDVGVEQWIIQKADNEEKCEDVDGLPTNSEDVVSSRYGDLSKQKSNTSLLSALMRSKLSEQERSQLLNVMGKVGKERRLHNLPTGRNFRVVKKIIPQQPHKCRPRKRRPPQARKESKSVHTKTEDNEDMLSRKFEKHANGRFNEQWTANEFKCRRCGEYCDTVCIYKEHYLYHRSLANSDGEYVQCCECGATVQNTYLRNHVKVHSGPFACSICGDTFSFKSKYDVHIKMHKQEGHTYLCTVCKKEFSYEFLLKRHSVIHEKYQCDICGHASSIKQAHESHRRKHKSKPVYSCDICKKTYSKAAALVSHMGKCHYIFQAQVSLLMKPQYQCHQCGCEFPEAVILKQHLATCGLVSTDLKDSAELKMSARCQICGATFLNAVALEKHTEGAHTMDTGDNGKMATKSD